MSEDVEPMRYSALVSGTLSATGALLLIILLLSWFRELRRISEEGMCNVTFRLTVCRFLLHLSACDFLASLSYIMGFFIHNGEPWACDLQAALMVAFETGSVLWSGSLAYLLWQVSRASAPNDWMREDFEAEMAALKWTEGVCTIISWGVPMAVAVTLAAIDQLGDRNTVTPWCWIKDEWTQLIFYIPLSVVMLFCIALLVLMYTNFRLYREIMLSVLKEKGAMAEMNADDREEAEQVDRDFRKSRNLVVWFILGFLFIWTWPWVTRIFSMCGVKVYALEVLQAVTAPLQGFTNFIVFGVIYLEFPSCLWRGWKRHYYIDIPNKVIDL